MERRAAHHQAFRLAAGARLAIDALANSALHRGDFWPRGPRFLGRGLWPIPGAAGSLREGRSSLRPGSPGLPSAGLRSLPAGAAPAPLQDRLWKRPSLSKYRIIWAIGFAIDCRRRPWRGRRRDLRGGVPGQQFRRRRRHDGVFHLHATRRDPRRNSWRLASRAAWDTKVGGSSKITDELAGCASLIFPTS